MVRTFGIELEFTNRGNHNERQWAEIFQNALERAGQPRDQVITTGDHERWHQDDNVHRLWQVKSEHCGREVTTPALQLTPENLTMLRTVVDSVREQMGGMRLANQSTGMHTHMSVGDLNPRQMHAFLSVMHRYEMNLLALQPPNRSRNGYVSKIRGNTNFCAALSATTFNLDRVRSALGDHYSAINFGHYSQWRTVEFRYAAGTAQGQKAYYWVLLLASLIEIAKTMSAPLPFVTSQPDFEEFVEHVATGRIEEGWIAAQQTKLARWMRFRREQLLPTPEPVG